MALKAKFQVKNKVGNRVVLVPVTGFQSIKRNKATGRKITEKQAAKLKREEIELEQKLTENTTLWDQHPSARMELVIDKASALKQINEGDVFELSFKKVK